MVLFLGPLHIFPDLTPAHLTHGDSDEQAADT